MSGLKCAARGSLKILDATIRHLRTVAKICPAIFSTKAYIDNRRHETHQ